MAAPPINDSTPRRDSPRHFQRAGENRVPPGDLGIVAMASLAIGIIDIMLDLGVNVTLIQNRDATQEHYDAAWTLRLIQSCLAGGAVYGAAGLAAEYFQEPRVADVMRTLSLVLAGAENIGTVAFQKHMRFGLEFRCLFMKRSIAFAVTIAAAWWLRNYWALVAGTVASRLAGAALSYLVHPMRPRLSFKRMGEILSFSTWILLRGIGFYLQNEAHRLIVGHRESTQVMGAYSLGGEIAAMPSTELLAPLSRVLFPSFVRVKDDPAELRRMYLLALGVPAGAGLALGDPELVQALPGEKWAAAAPFIQVIGALQRHPGHHQQQQLPAPRPGPGPGVRGLRVDTVGLVRGGGGMGHPQGRRPGHRPVAPGRGGPGPGPLHPVRLPRPARPRPAVPGWPGLAAARRRLLDGPGAGGPPCRRGCRPWRRWQRCC